MLSICFLDSYLNAADALVPFYAFGANDDSLWFRISVGVFSMEDVKEVCESLKKNIGMLR